VSHIAASIGFVKTNPKKKKLTEKELSIINEILQAI